MKRPDVARRWTEHYGSKPVRRKPRKRVRREGD
jgi:hypothetical protein